jgi:hypothetical protein
MSSIKLLFGEEMRRLSRPPQTIEELRRVTETMYEIQHSDFRYQDEEDDWITVTNQAEYRGALDFAAGKLLKLVVSVRDPGLTDSFIPMTSNMSLSSSIMSSSSFTGFCAKQQPSQELVEDTRHKLTYPRLDKPSSEASHQPRSSVAIDDEFKQSIRDAIREELSSMIIKPRAKSKEVFQYICSNCLVGPIPSVIYVCLSCPNYYWCEACEEALDHEHALLKIKNTNMMQQVTAHTQSLLSSRPCQPHPQPVLMHPPPSTIAAKDLRDLTEKLRAFGFAVNETTMKVLERNHYDLSETIDELLKPRVQ